MTWTPRCGIASPTFSFLQIPLWIHRSWTEMNSPNSSMTTTTATMLSKESSWHQATTEYVHLLQRIRISYPEFARPSIVDNRRQSFWALHILKLLLRKVLVWHKVSSCDLQVTVQQLWKAWVLYFSCWDNQNRGTFELNMVNTTIYIGVSLYAQRALILHCLLTCNDMPKCTNLVLKYAMCSELHNPDVSWELHIIVPLQRLKDSCRTETEEALALMDVKTLLWEVQQ